MLRYLDGVIGITSHGLSSRLREPGAVVICTCCCHLFALILTYLLHIRSHSLHDNRKHA